MSQTLKCSHCGEQKNPDAFPKASGKPRGYAWVCKKCKIERRKEKQASMSEDDWKKQNRRYWLKTSYGITLEEFDDKLKAQNNKCAICQCDSENAFNNTLYVDHCHNSNKLRGLLCHACNSALGKFRDSVSILKNAIAYLEKHK
jgi:hypothetical protein